MAFHWIDRIRLFRVHQEPTNPFAHLISNFCDVPVGLTKIFHSSSSCPSSPNNPLLIYSLYSNLKLSNVEKLNNKYKIQLILFLSAHFTFFSFKVKSLTMALKTKEQRITELTNEVNDLASKASAMPTPSSGPRSNSSVSTTPIRRIDSADECKTFLSRKFFFSFDL